MGFIDKKMTQHLQKQEQQVWKDVRDGGRSVQAAQNVLRKWPNIKDYYFTHCSLKELKVWREAVQSKRSMRHLLPAIDQLIIEQQKKSADASKQKQSKAAASRKFKSFENLSARELISEAEELQAHEIEQLLGWETENKNRASVINALNQILGSSTNSSSRSNPIAKKDLGPNPFKEQNEKIYKKGRGTVREQCQECGEINAIDVSLLSQVVHRRSNTTRGRMESWSDRQIEGGARMTGQHAAAETSRANQMHIAGLVTSGFPCSSCGAPLLK